MSATLSALSALGAGLPAAGIALNHGVGFAIRRWNAIRLARRCQGALLLTYDDGPSPRATPRTLELLRRHDARATFFVVGSRARREPELCDQILEAGHEIASHGERHANAWLAAPWKAGREVHDSYASLARWMRPDAAFRPPFGKITLPSWWATRARGVPIITWTHDSGDTWKTRPDPGSVVDRVVAQQGGVVLMHCHARDAGRIDYVLQLTDALLQAARKHELQVRTCAQLLATER